MADKKFTREEYEKLTKENMKIFSELDKQIAEEREEKEKYLSTLSEDEQVEYLWEENKKTDAEAVGRFNSLHEIATKNVDE